MLPSSAEGFGFKSGPNTVLLVPKLIAISPTLSLRPTRVQGLSPLAWITTHEDGNPYLF